MSACAATPCRRGKQVRAFLLQLLRVGEADRASACRGCELVWVMVPSRTVMVPSSEIVMSWSVGWKVIGAVGAEHRIAGCGDELALRVDLERAVAGVALAARRLHREEALAVDGDVERVLGVLERALRQMS